MIRLKINKEIILGSIFLVISSMIFTLERFMSLIKWIGESAPVKINGSGQYPTFPTMPSIIDNFFVFLFLCISVLLIVIGIVKEYKNKAQGTCCQDITGRAKREALGYCLRRSIIEGCRITESRCEIRWIEL